MNLRSPAGTKIVGGVSLLLIAALGWLFIIKPQFSALTEVRTQTTDTIAQNQVLSAQLADLEEQQEQLPQIRAAAAALAAKFPATADQPGLFEAVATAATAAGIKGDALTALTPSPPVLGNGDETAAVTLPVEGEIGTLATQTVTVTVEASYEDTRQLLDNLEQSSRAYLVTSLSVAAVAPETAAETARLADSYTTTITGDMFVMAQPAELEAPAPATAGDTS